MEPAPKTISSRERGAALVIVLAFVVLLTGLAVAYLSRATSDRPVAHSSFNQSKADQLAASGMDLVIGGLRQEITGPAPTPTPPTAPYVPANNARMLPLRTAINKVKKENQRVRKEDVRVTQNGESRITNLEVIPLKNLKEPSFLIMFEPGESSRSKRTPRAKAKPPSKSVHAQESREVARLEQELAETRDYVQAIQEQYDAANEELQGVG